MLFLELPFEKVLLRRHIADLSDPNQQHSKLNFVTIISETELTFFKAK